jgi:hypothetical protein
MARHRRHQQKPRLGALRGVGENALEVEKAAEWPFPYRLDLHRHALTTDQRRGDAPFGPAVTARRAFE